MKIELHKIKIKNSKGVKKFEHDFKGKSAEIHGQNGTGKSTIADMFFWLMTGKNSDLSASFNILPLAPDGSRIDHVDAEVAATLKIDGKKIELKKVHRQKWTKKRGQAIEEYTGNTTDHYIDGVPISQTEFNNRLAGIIDDNLFRVLSDVRYFCGSLKPDQRRQILIDLCGDVSPSEIIAANPKLAELDSIMSNHELNDHKKILNQRRKAINKQIDQIPGNIKELQGMIADVSGYDRDALQKQLDDLDDRIKDGIYRVGELTSGTEQHDLKKKLIDYNAELNQLEFDTRKLNNDHIAKKSDEKVSQEKTLSALRIEQDADSGRLKNFEIEMIENEAKRDDLKKRWSDENATSFAPSPSCFACGQLLPPDQIAEQKDKFNSQKAERLRQINDLGTSLFQDHALLCRKKDALLEIMEQRVNKIDSIMKTIESIDKQIHEINNQNGKQYAAKQLEIMSKIEQVETKIEQLNTNIEPAKNALKTRIEAMEHEKDVVNSKLLEIAHAEKTAKRIAELKSEQKDLIAEYQKSEHELWMIDEYGRKRAEYIENSVSGHFKIVQWKLFEEQQNGGIRDICEPLVNGVPYNSDLNYAAKILAGLDCIETLAKHYDTRVPVFIDNAESLSRDGIVVTWPKQFIKLKVVDDQKELKIEKM